jgi:thiol:disulfide interchange protein DsbD
MFTNRLSNDLDPISRLATIALFILLGVICWRSFHPSTTFAADGLDPTWDRAVTESRNANRPTVIIFTASWCPACQALHADTLSQSDIRRELYGKFTVLTVDLTNPTPAEQQHAAKLGVSAIPTRNRDDRSGKETDRTHYLPPTPCSPGSAPANN